MTKIIITNTLFSLFYLIKFHYKHINFLLIDIYTKQSGNNQISSRLILKF